MTDQHEPRGIRVLADYQCHPLWLVHPDAGDLSPEDPSLGLSADLAGRLADWAAEYDAILDWDDPASSAFAEPEAEEAFYALGRTLAERLAEELGGGWRVTYFDGRLRRDVDVPGAA
ncbi:hypothetical protein [Kitasatospora viridis]|uniref:Uncharacterized protein n=1 Tax=Kitasatospora viridis TaxID=281105 RepID=A0A561TV05_9ACTN|nr:hypothetical protein [Kitasatospora viridis]TWF90940.1 hypothetical protein FHX73_1252 [Kitasatospora viridis]